MRRSTSTDKAKKTPPPTVRWIDAAAGRLPLRGLAWARENGGGFNPASLGFALLADRLGEAIREILFAEGDATERIMARAHYMIGTGR